MFGQHSTIGRTSNGKGRKGEDGLFLMLGALEERPDGLARMLGNRKKEVRNLPGRRIGRKGRESRDVLAFAGAGCKRTMRMPYPALYGG